MKQNAQHVMNTLPGRIGLLTVKSHTFSDN